MIVRLKTADTRKVGGGWLPARGQEVTVYELRDDGTEVGMTNVMSVTFDKIERQKVTNCFLEMADGTTVEANVVFG
jgi:hypothetical protein